MSSSITKIAARFMVPQLRHSTSLRSRNMYHLPSIPEVEYLQDKKNRGKNEVSLTITQAVALAAASASIAVLITSMVAASMFTRHFEDSFVPPASSASVGSMMVRSHSLQAREQSFPLQAGATHGNQGPSEVSVESRINDGPKVAWLMSFPNSGTSFTLHLTREATNTTTATNYALEGDIKDLPSVPIREASKNGPFLELIRDRNTTSPQKYILTKTHCNGFCSDCLHYIETPRSFQIACQSGRKAFFDGEGRVKVAASTYDVGQVAKAVHLVRHPLDNIVARFHLIHNRHKRKNSTNWTARHPYNQTGFAVFCKSLDARSQLRTQRWIDAKLARLLDKVPCHEDFFRYVQWHNLAFSMTRDMAIPTHVIHYQDYRDDLEQTLIRLLSFLELPRTGQAEEFHHGKEYLDHYTREERKAVRAFIEEYATEITWKHVKDYDFGVDLVEH